MNDITLFALCAAIPPVVYYGYKWIEQRIDQYTNDKMMVDTAKKIMEQLEKFRDELENARTVEDLVNIIRVTKYPFEAKSEIEIHFPLEYIHGYGYFASMESKMELDNDIRMYESIENKDFARDSRYLKSMVDEKLNMLKNVMEVKDAFDN